MSWWDLGEGRGYRNGLPMHQIACAFCGVTDNFEKVQHSERKKPGNDHKKLNYDTLKCGQRGNLMFVFWSTGSNGLTDYHLLPWPRSTKLHTEHWPPDIGRYWVEAKRSIEIENWIAAALMINMVLLVI